MHCNVTLLAVMSLTVLLGSATWADEPAAKEASVVLAAMADGIGDLTFAAPEWATPQKFDRHPDYDPSWLRYDHVDIYGEPR